MKRSSRDSTSTHKNAQSRHPSGTNLPTVVVGSREANAELLSVQRMRNLVSLFPAHVANKLPAFARNSHGNLADQNRLVGAQHGADTARAEGSPRLPSLASQEAAKVDTLLSSAATGSQSDSKAALALTQQNNCIGCHAIDRKILGPSWTDIAKKHAGKADYLAAKIRSGGAGVWGSIPMPAQGLNEADTRRIAEWLASGAAP